MILAGQKENLQRLGSGDILKSFTGKNILIHILNYHFFKRSLPQTEMEMPIQHSLFIMEIAGMSVCPTAMNRLNDQIEELMQRLEKKMFKMHGRRFNIASSGEVAKVLNMRGSNNGVEKTGRVSTAKAVLEKMTDDPMSTLIMQWRKLSAALNKTLRPLQRNVYRNR